MSKNLLDPNEEFETTHTVDEVNLFISEFPDTSEISNGFITFGELEHKCQMLFLLLLQNPPLGTEAVSIRPEDPETDWFFGLLKTQAGDVVQNLPMSYWSKLRNRIENASEENQCDFPFSDEFNSKLWKVINTNTLNQSMG